MSDSTRPGRTSQELRDAVRHIRYEVNQMIQAKQLYEQSGSGDQSQRNAYLESMLIHVRNLCEFLACAEQARNDTAICSDFGFPAQEPLDRAEIRRIHKRLAHPSYSRDSLDEEWDLELILKRLAKPCADFADQVLDEKVPFHLSPEEHDTWDRLRTVLRRL